MDKPFTTPSEGAIKEALNHPNSYVYVIDEEYADKQDVPAEAIAGAWKVNEHGIIAGPFIPNAKYQPKK
jgi:hypothetical protein